MTLSGLVLVWGLLAISTASALGESANKDYEGYKIMDVWASSEQQLPILQDFYTRYADELDFLITSRIVDQPLRFLSTFAQEQEVLNFFEQYNLDFKIINANLTASLEAEQLQQQRNTPSQRTARSGLNNFESYLRYSDIDGYLAYLATAYPQSVSVQSVGRSQEGRDLKAILIRSAYNASTARLTLRQTKPLILIDAAIHAREWIALEAALYVVQQLVENATYYAEELNAYDWLVWPLVNPDGYEYTHEHERFWRKTRRPSGQQTSCVGTDANRNFDFHWGDVGASSNPCSDTYKGPTAFSEPEAVALKNLMFRVNSTCRMYLTLHSYGNYLLYPWGYDASLPPTWKYLDAVARAGADAIEAVTGTKYTVGSSTNVLYAASGASDDFALGVANIPVSLTMELPAGGTGFDPPASQIRPIVEETWIGIRAMVAKLLELGDFEVDPDGNSAAGDISKNIFWNLLF